MTLALTPGAYLARRRQAAGMSIDDVAERIATDPRLDQRARCAWLAQMEADLSPIAAESINALALCFPFSRIALQALANHAREPDRFAVPRICRTCACSELDACLSADRVPCAWKEDDLCTACAFPDPRANAERPVASASPSNLEREEAVE